MTRYASPLIFIHWLMAVAVIIAYVSSGDPTKASQAISGQVHVGSGLAVFALLALRLPLRALFGAPPAEPGPLWQQRATVAVHLALYGLMAVVPLAGWAELAHKTAAFSLAGGFALPLPDAHAAWVRLLGSAHQTLGNVFIWLAGLHAAAALVHHYVLRDATLVRMLPRRR